MSIATYGSTEIHVESISIDANPIVISEVEVIPNPSTPEVENTVLIGAGGNKKTIYSISGFCTAAEYSALNTLLLAKSANNLTIYYNAVALVNAVSCHIQSIKINTKAGEKKINIDMSFIEV
jgi:hypothetical protein